MNNKDYVPKQEVLFYEWQHRLIAYVSGKQAVFNVPKDELAELTESQLDYETKYEKAENPATRTPGATTAKIEAHKAYEARLRRFNKEYLTYNHNVSDEDRRNMALPIHDTKPTHPDVPKTMVVGKVDFSVHQQHTVRVEDSTGKHRADNVRGFETWRKVGGDPPVTDADFEYVGFSSSTSLVINYPLEAVGQVVYYRSRWLNSLNQPGPWSEGVIIAVIA